MLKTYLAANSRLQNLKNRFANDDDGAALVEYSILIGIITVLAVASIVLVGNWVSTQWGALVTAIGA